MKYLFILLLPFLFIPDEAQANDVLGSCSGTWPGTSSATDLTEAQCLSFVESGDNYASTFHYGGSAGACTRPILSSSDYQVGSWETNFCGEVMPEDAVCPSGQIPDSFSGICYTPTEPVPELSCSNVLGTLNGLQICGDDKDDCDAIGGIYGSDGSGMACYEPLPEPVVCASGTFMFVNSFGDYICVSPDSTPPEPEPVDPDDNDGDGIPNSTDDDDDGDGILDTADTDANGDGVIDVDTDGDGFFNYVDFDDDNDGIDDLLDADRDGDGVGDCDPSSANYSQCTGLVTDTDITPTDFLSSANLDARTGLDKLETSFLESIAGGEAIPEPTGLTSNIATSFFTVNSCADVVFSVLGGDIVVSCSKLEPLRDILGFIAYVLSAYLLISLAFSPISDKRGA